MFRSKEKTKIHFIGIGGIGMSGIAEILARMGYGVQGSDLKKNPITDKLEALGVNIIEGHKEENINDQVTVIVYSSAISPDNPERVKGRELNIPEIRRAEMLAELMRLKYGIAVAGTHGKTTTSSILATVLHEVGINPTHIIGGVVENLGGNAKLGKSDFLLAEADESDGSFLLLNPVLSVITNIDNDHLDFYKEESKIYDAFLEFSNKVPFYGFNILNSHDIKIQKLIEQSNRPYLSFGLENNADYCAKNIKQDSLGSRFELFVKEVKRADVKLNLPGDHNILNSLGAIAVAHQISDDIEGICRAVEKFNGVGRRFEKLYDQNNFLVVDDYAHHPTEVKATLKAAKALNKELVVIFEPHRFSRTKDCWDQFVDSFKDCPNLYILPIYAASEAPIKGIDSKEFTKAINGSSYLNSWEEAEDLLGGLKEKDVIVLTLGAGAIGRNIRNWVLKI